MCGWGVCVKKGVVNFWRGGDLKGGVSKVGVGVEVGKK